MNIKLKDFMKDFRTNWYEISLVSYLILFLYARTKGDFLPTAHFPPRLFHFPCTAVMMQNSCKFTKSRFLCNRPKHTPVPHLHTHTHTGIMIWHIKKKYLWSNIFLKNLVLIKKKYFYLSAISFQYN